MAKNNKIITMSIFNKIKWKKISQSLLKNIPWYEINNDRQNAEKQIKIEKKILDLLSPKSFKITNSSFIQETKEPIIKLPDFLIINWPKGIDDSYFKSYEVLEYFKDLGMIKFKLTLSHNTSKEYTIKGFDTWEDILEDAETLINNTLNSENLKKYLSSIDFKAKFGEIVDDKFDEFTKDIYKNIFIKRDAINFKITSMDYSNYAFKIESKWKLDPKYSYITEFKSDYVRYLGEQKKLLSEFINQDTNLNNIVTNLEWKYLKDQNLLNEYLQEKLQDYINIYSIKKLKFQIINMDILNCSFNLKALDTGLDLFEIKTFSSNTLIRQYKLKEKLNMLINNIEFLAEIKNNFINNSLEEEKNNILDKYIREEKEEIEFIYSENKNYPLLMIELRNMENEYLSSSTSITLNNKYDKDKTNDFNTFDLYKFTINDLNFLKIVVDNYTNFQGYNNIFEKVMSKYESEWKEKILNNPSRISLFLDQDFKYIKINISVLGTNIDKSIYSEVLLEKMRLNILMNELVNNNEFINYIKSLTYKDINNNFSINKNIEDFEFENKLLKEIIRSYNIYTSFESPYNLINISFKQKENEEIIFTKNINVNSYNYKALFTLFANPPFLEQLQNFINPYFNNSDKELDKEEIINLININSNGIMYKNISFNIEREDEIIKFIIHFDFLYPDISINIKKIKEDININELINEFVQEIESILQTKNEIFDSNQSEYNISDISKKISKKFEPLNNIDGKITINDSTNKGNSLITFDIHIKSLNIEISSYADFFPILKKNWDEFYSLLDENKKNELIKLIQEDNVLSFAKNSDILNSIFNNLNWPKNLKKTKILFKNSSIYYNDKLLEEIK